MNVIRQAYQLLDKRTEPFMLTLESMFAVH